jgi:hypothetical protein
MMAWIAAGVVVAGLVAAYAKLVAVFAELAEYVEGE